MGNLTACCSKPSKPNRTTRSPATALTGMPLMVHDSDNSMKPVHPSRIASSHPAGLQQLTSVAEHSNANASVYTDLSHAASFQDLFSRYKEPKENAILIEGLQRFCSDLDVSPDDFRILVLAWKFGAATMCCFSEAEFVGGCRALGVHSIDSIKLKLPALLQEVASEKHFKDFYRWSYKFALESDIGQRTLPTDLAISLWRLVFSQREPPILGRWLNFLEKNPSIKGIARDTWDMFLIFVEQIGENLDAYSDSEAWPSLLDDFVDGERAAAASAAVTDTLTCPS